MSSTHRNLHNHGQKENHRKKRFHKEYVELLREGVIEFDERFLW